MDYRFDTVAIVVSQHYRLLRAIVASGTEIRLPTTEEAQMADYLTDVLETVVGRRLANYCRERFRQGWMTRDLRSYKIKFVLTKLRDLLSEGSAHDELKTRLSDLTDTAEQLAGCKSDNKRRNRQARAEQARKKEEKKALRQQKAAERPTQMLLFDDPVPEKPAEVPVQESNLDDTLLDEVELLVRPVCPSGRIRPNRRSESDDATAFVKSDRRKKSRSEKKFEKLTQEILQSEYAEESEDADAEQYTENNLQDIARSYGLYSVDSDNRWDTDDYGDGETEDGAENMTDNEDDYEEDTDV